MPRPLRWLGDAGATLLRREDERRGEVRKKARVHRKHEYSQLESYKEYSDSGRRRLESLEGAFRFLFANSATRLGYMQKKLIDVVTIALLSKIFGADLVGNLRYIHKKYLIDELNDTVAILFPRRSGKTEGSAIMIAVVAVSQPHGNCIMYNLTATQAKEFLQAVKKYLDVFQHSEEYGWTMVRKDVRQLMEIRTRKYGTLNSIKSYPSALKGDAKIDPRRGTPDCPGAMPPPDTHSPPLLPISPSHVLHSLLTRPACRANGLYSFTAAGSARTPPRPSQSRLAARPTPCRDRWPAPGRAAAQSRAPSCPAVAA